MNKHLNGPLNEKLLWGGLNQWVSGSVSQWVSSMIGKRSYESRIMMPRLNPETNENQHKRFAQHIGSPRRGAPGRRRQKKLPDVRNNSIFDVLAIFFVARKTRVKKSTGLLSWYLKFLVFSLLCAYSSLLF